MDLFTYLMAKKGQNTQRDLFSYLLGKGAGGSGTYVNFTGTLLNISNTLRARIKNITLKGATSQHTTTGKNLFDKNNANILSAYIALGNSKITYSNGDNCIYIPVKSNTTYTVSKILSKRFVVGFTDVLPAIAVVCNPISTNQNSNTSITITSGSDSKYLVVNCYTNTDTPTLDEILNSIQIEEGNTATDYEEYTGGQPSPSPDYPQPIKVVTGEQNVNISSRNLLDISNGLNSSNRGIDYILNDNGSITLRGTSTTTYSYVTATVTLTKPLEIGTYTYSIDHTISGQWRIILTYDDNTTETKAITPGTTYITFKATKKIIKYYISFSNIEQGTTYNETLFIQLEQGSNATPYTPYYNKDYPLSLGTLELAKIGDYQDYIYGSPNNWYKKGYVRHLSLAIKNMNNSENYPGWVNSQFRTDLGVNRNGQLNSFTTYGSNITLLNAYGVAVNTGEVSSNYSALWLSKAIFGLTQTQWKTNYPDLVFELFYGSLIPYDEQITDTTLITQLNNLYNATSQEGTTYITCSSTSDDNETIVFSGDIKVTSVGNSLNTSLLSSNIQEEPNLDDVNETEDIEQNDEPIENEEIEEKVS